MTDQHPLTDEMLESIAPLRELAGDVFEYERRAMEECAVLRHCEMRAAYDKGMEDRLESVIKWLRDNLCIEEDGLPRYLNNTTPVLLHEECAVIYKWKIIADLKEAMRPTTTQEDN